MQDFIMYLQLRKPGNPQRKEYTIEELKNAPATSSIKGLELVKGGSLTLVRETGLLNVFGFSGEFPLPRPQAAKRVEYTPMNFNIWQQKKGDLVISLRAPKKLSKIAISLLSHATNGDPFLIRPIQLTKSDFIALKTNILQHGGDLRQLILWGIKDTANAAARIKQFRLSGSRLQRLPNFDEMLVGSSRIRLLGFSFKPTADCREISFRILDWGEGQLYSPADPLDHEILEFLNTFEQVLKPYKQDTSE